MKNEVMKLIEKIGHEGFVVALLEYDRQMDKKDAKKAYENWCENDNETTITTSGFEVSKMEQNIYLIRVECEEPYFIDEKDGNTLFHHLNRTDTGIITAFKIKRKNEDLVNLYMEMRECEFDAENTIIDTDEISVCDYEEGRSEAYQVMQSKLLKIIIDRHFEL